MCNVSHHSLKVTVLGIVRSHVKGRAGLQCLLLIGLLLHSVRSAAAIPLFSTTMCRVSAPCLDCVLVLNVQCHIEKELSLLLNTCSVSGCWGPRPRPRRLSLPSLTPASLSELQALGCLPCVRAQTVLGLPLELSDRDWGRSLKAKVKLAKLRDK